MSRPNSHSPGRMSRLAGLARQDAERLTPGFSETRHARIIHAVDRARNRAMLTAAMPMTLPGPRPHPRRSLLAPMGLAAAVAAVAIWGAWFVGHGQSQVLPQLVKQNPAVRTVARPQPPILALDQAAHEVNVNVQGAVETAMAQQQWAGLDQDVRAATRYFVDQVPLRAAWQGEATQDAKN